MACDPDITSHTKPLRLPKSRQRIQRSGNFRVRVVANLNMPKVVEASQFQVVATVETIYICCSSIYIPLSTCCSSIYIPLSTCFHQSTHHSLAFVASIKITFSNFCCVNLNTTLHPLLRQSSHHSLNVVASI